MFTLYNCIHSVLMKIINVYFIQLHTFCSYENKFELYTCTIQTLKKSHNIKTCKMIIKTSVVPKLLQDEN